MASLFFRAPPTSQPFQPVSKSFSRRLPPCTIRTHFSHPNQSATRLSEDYKRSWRDEIKRVKSPSGSESPAHEELSDDHFQELVDRRGVDNVRMLIVDAIQTARAGHPGMALGMAEVGYLLFRHAMRYNPKNPKWFNRDRFVLSAGHGCLLQYVCMHLAGFHSVQVEDLKRLCKLGSRTPGHPENVVTSGVEVTTGMLYV